MNLLVKEIDDNIRINNFCCKNKEVDSFLQEKALENNKNYYSKVYILLDIETSESVGLITLSSYILNLPSTKVYNIQRVPAVLMGRLGIDNKHRNNNYTIEYLIPYAMAVCYKVMDLIGCRLLIAEVERGDKLREYLTRNGFIELHCNKKYHFLCIDLLKFKSNNNELPEIQSNFLKKRGSKIKALFRRLSLG